MKKVTFAVKYDTILLAWDERGEKQISTNLAEICLE